MAIHDAAVAVPSWSGRNFSHNLNMISGTLVAVPSWSGRNYLKSKDIAIETDRRPLMVGSEPIVALVSKLL